MKKFLVALLSVVSCWAAADITGNWMSVEHRPDGTEQRTYFNLAQHDGQITGVVHSNRFYFVVLESSSGPDGFTLKVGPKDGNMRRVRKYQLRLIGDELHINTLSAPSETAS